MNAIEIRNLTKRYKDTVAVDELNLDIYEGELFSLLGVNGAGKSTTIKILSTLILSDSGDATLLGKSVRNEPEAVKAFIAVSPQETAVAKNLTVLENLELISGIYGYTGSEGKERIFRLAEEISLQDVLKKRAGKLSGGYQRRLSIAMALIGEPRILFLDEPTLGLDVISRSELWDIIRSLKNKVTVVLTTHYMEEAEALSDRIGIMDKGRLIALGTAKELMESAGADRFENAFISIVRGENA